MKNTLLLFTLTLYLLAATVSMAQPDKPRIHRLNREMHQEMTAYTQQNITPVMQQQRLKLENQLSSADKTKIRELRNRLTGARKLGAAFPKEMRSHRQQLGTEGPTEEQRVQLQNHRAVMASIQTEARTLTQKYEKNIRVLYKEVAEPAETWQQGLKLITEKYKVPNQNESAPTRQQRFGRRFPQHRLLNEYFRPVQFLLWEVKNEIATEDLTQLSGNRLFPNPVTTSATLSYSVKQDGLVTVDLLDEHGKLIRSLVNKSQAPGNYSLDLNLSNLKKGFYFYKITTGSGTLTERFIKN